MEEFLQPSVDAGDRAFDDRDLASRCSMMHVAGAMHQGNIAEFTMLPISSGHTVSGASAMSAGGTTACVLMPMSSVHVEAAHEHNPPLPPMSADVAHSLLMPEHNPKICPLCHYEFTQKRCATPF